MELERLRRAFDEQAVEKAALRARVRELEQKESDSHGSGDSGHMLPPPVPVVAVRAPEAQSDSIASSAQTQQVEMLQAERVAQDARIAAQDARIAALDYENQRLREQRTPLTQDQGPAAAVQGPISPLQQPDFGVGSHQVGDPLPTIDTFAALLELSGITLDEILDALPTTQPGTPEADALRREGSEHGSDESLDPQDQPQTPAGRNMHTPRPITFGGFDGSHQDSDFSSVSSIAGEINLDAFSTKHTDPAVAAGVDTWMLTSDMDVEVTGENPVDRTKPTSTPTTISKRKGVETRQAKPARQALADGGVRELGRQFNHLAVAASAGDARATAALLEQGHDPNEQKCLLVGPNEYPLKMDTPLKKAAESGLADVARTLLIARADPMAVSEAEWGEPGGRAPLMAAVMEGHVAMIPLLVLNRADVNAADNHSGITPLHAACAWEHSEVVETLLCTCADVHVSTYDEKTPLHLAAAVGSIDICTTLLSAGADPRALDVNLCSPLAAAVSMGNANLVASLVAANADVNARIAPANRRRGEETCMPLLYAAAVLLVSSELVQALLRAGADRNAIDADGWRADQQLKREFFELNSLWMAERHVERAEAFFGHELWDHGLFVGQVTEEVLLARGIDASLIDPQHRIQLLQGRRQAIYQLLQGEPLITSGINDNGGGGDGGDGGGDGGGTANWVTIRFSTTL